MDLEIYIKPKSDDICLFFQYTCICYMGKKKRSSHFGLTQGSGFIVVYRVVENRIMACLAIAWDTASIVHLFRR